MVGRQARALYKGMGSPLAANAPINAIIFATFGSSLRLMAARWGAPASDAELYSVWRGILQVQTNTICNRQRLRVWVLVVLTRDAACSAAHVRRRVRRGLPPVVRHGADGTREVQAAGARMPICIRVVLCVSECSRAAGAGQRGRHEVGVRGPA